MVAQRAAIKYQMVLCRWEIELDCEQIIGIRFFMYFYR